MKKRKLNWKLIFNISVIVFSIGLLVYFAVSENGLNDLVKNISSFDRGWLFMAVFCHLLNIFIDAYLIFIFTKSSANHYRLRDALKSCMVGQFFSAVTPGASGGQPMQLIVMNKQNVDTGKALSALMQKFLVYQTTITSYSALSILVCYDFFKSNLDSFMWTLSIFGFCSQAFVIALLLLFSFNKKITHTILVYVFNLLARIKIIKNPQEKINNLEEQLNSFHACNKELYKNKNLVLKTYVLTTVQLTCIFIVPYCIYRSFNLSGARVIDMVCAQAFVSMISSFVPLPGASGVSEGSFYIFFSMYYTAQTIKSAVLLWRIITYYFTIFLTAPFARLTKDKNKT